MKKSEIIKELKRLLELDISNQAGINKGLIDIIKEKL